MAACARVWTLIVGTMAGVTFPDQVDPTWREMCRKETGSGPATLRDREDATGERVAQAVKDIVADVKRQIFPHHGLEPSSRASR